MLSDYNERSEILLTYSTDVHFCNSFSYLSKKPYEIEHPVDVKLSDYKMMFLKRQSEKLGMTIEIIGLHVGEYRVESMLAYLL
jgi:hypothetical protein